LCAPYPALTSSQRPALDLPASSLPG
jgi:hypothetical protein